MSENDELSAEREARQAAERHRDALQTRVEELQAREAQLDVLHDRVGDVQATVDALAAPPPPKTLDRKVAEAEAAMRSADNVTDRHHALHDAMALKSQKMADLTRRTNPSTGRIEPAAEAYAEELSHAVTGEPSAPPGSFDGGARKSVSTPTIDDKIAEANARGDVLTAVRLKQKAYEGTFAKLRAGQDV